MLVLVARDGDGRLQTLLGPEDLLAREAGRQDVGVGARRQGTQQADDGERGDRDGEARPDRGRGVGGSDGDAASALRQASSVKVALLPRSGTSRKPAASAPKIAPKTLAA